MKSASVAEKIIGGFIRSVLPQSPPLPISRPMSLHASNTAAHSSLAGSFVLRSFTSSMPSMSPSPRMSPIRECFADSLANPALRRSEEHTSELQSLRHLVCRLLLEKKKKTIQQETNQHTTAYHQSAGLSQCYE